MIKPSLVIFSLWSTAKLITSLIAIFIMGASSLYRSNILVTTSANPRSPSFPLLLGVKKMLIYIKKKSSIKMIVCGGLP